MSPQAPQVPSSSKSARSSTWLVAHLRLQNVASAAEFNRHGLSNTGDWIGLLRERKEFEICIGQNEFWIRVDVGRCKDALDVLQLIPCVTIYQLIEGDRLVPLGRTVPVMKLLEGAQWRPFRDVIRLQLMPSIPARVSHDDLPVRPNNYKIELAWRIRESIEEPDAMICQWSDFERFVDRSTRNVFQHLRFARSQTSSLHAGRVVGDTLVLGSPLPQIPGMRLKNEDRVVIPIQYVWFPHVSADVIRKSNSRLGAKWILWLDPNRIELIEDQYIVPCTRASVAMSRDESRNSLRREAGGSND